MRKILAFCFTSPILFSSLQVGAQIDYLTSRNLGMVVHISAMVNPCMPSQTNKKRT